MNLRALRAYSAVGKPSVGMGKRLKNCGTTASQLADPRLGDEAPRK